MILGACAYDTHFEDCTVRCTTDIGCPVGLTCEAGGFCRTPGETATCAAGLETFPSCAGLAETCGPNADEDCCSTATPIPGGTFFRSHDVAGDGMYPGTSYPATVSPFMLDKYEVTVGRFRKFVLAGMGTQASAPAIGAGARTLNGMEAQGGWDTSWNASLSASTAALTEAVKCNANQSWTDMPGTNEVLPMNCITWFEAFAFCVSDGGFLPTEAEWNYVAAGGNEQRAYPWSSPPDTLAIDCSYANYDNGTAYCANPPNGAVKNVGSESPKGDGKWGHADLGGNVWEWSLDWFQSAYANPCNDCANLTAGSNRQFRGGSFLNFATDLRTARRYEFVPTFRGPNIGVRCARRT